MSVLRAFHNDPAIKAFYLARVEAHRQADELIHGRYWSDGKGCAVGCTLHSNMHEAYETELEIPCVLARLEDTIFEGLGAPEDQAWPSQFLAAIPVGADLTGIWPRFAVALLGDPHHGALCYVQGADFVEQRRAITRVLHLYQRLTLAPSTEAAWAARAAAAAAEAAWAARAAAAAAWAAWAAEAAATGTAEAAAFAWAAWAAWAVATGTAEAAAEARVWQAQTLLALLRAAPVQEGL